MQQAIGGEFAAIGFLEQELLRSEGLHPHSSLVDIGCGSGRLACQLGTWMKGPYLGLDVVQDLLDHAARITARPDWNFQLAPGLTVPVLDSSVDMVSAFSLFTHLLHEETYRYLEDIFRILRPGGKLVFSFLEFSIPSHWSVFETNLAAIGTTGVLNQFMSRDAIELWASRIGFEPPRFFDGDRPHIPLSRRVELESGQTYEGLGALGQSVAVLVKPAHDAVGVTADLDDERPA